MEEHFYFTITNRPNRLVMELSTILYFLLVCVPGIVLLSDRLQSAGRGGVWIPVWFFSSMTVWYIVQHWLVKKVFGEPLHLTIQPDRLVVQNQETEVESVFPFNTIASYRLKRRRGWEWLIVKMEDGTTWSMRRMRIMNSVLRPVADSLERAIHHYQQQPGVTHMVVREKSFWGY